MTFCKILQVQHHENVSGNIFKSGVIDYLLHFLEKILQKCPLFFAIFRQFLATTSDDGVKLRFIFFKNAKKLKKSKGTRELDALLTQLSVAQASSAEAMMLVGRAWCRWRQNLDARALYR